LVWDQQLASAIQDAIAAGETNLVERFQPTFERTLLDQALDATGGKKAQAAELIGWGRNTLTRKLAELK
jgi:two-component system nitrogen regulation response regulator GlnG